MPTTEALIDSLVYFTDDHQLEVNSWHSKNHVNVVNIAYMVIILTVIRLYCLVSGSRAKRMGEWPTVCVAERRQDENQKYPVVSK